VCEGSLRAERASHEGSGGHAGTSLALTRRAAAGSIKLGPTAIASFLDGDVNTGAHRGHRESPLELASMLRESFKAILAAAGKACLAVYGERLVSLAVFGSVARGTMRHDSDIDLLLVVDGLPRGRMASVREFEAVEIQLTSQLREAAEKGVHTTLSPVLKTPEDLANGSPLFLDMTIEVLILHDRNGLLPAYLQQLQERLAALGSRWIRKCGGYYWLLKPDLKPGEDFSL